MVGVWSLPGGSVEPGETVLEAAHRELAEETGVTASLDHLVGIFDVIRRDAGGEVVFHYAIACYAGRWLSGEAVAGSDAMSARWMLESELGGLAFVPNVREAIRRARAFL